MKKLFGAFAILIISATANAGLLLEPYLGYDSGAFSSTRKVGGAQTESTSSGADYGLRLGYKAPAMLWVAGEYSGGSGTLKYSKPAGSQDETTGRTMIGVTIGVDFPMMLRLWAGYMFTNDFSSSDSTGAKTTLKGNATKLGLGYKLIPMLSLNAEYFMETYSKYTATSGSTTLDGDIGDLFSSYSSSHFLISVSAPFDF